MKIAQLLENDLVLKMNPDESGRLPPDLPSGLPDTVNGKFVCSAMDLTSLKGCPRVVHGNFSCAGNKLTSLEYCPIHVDKDFICVNNNITSLKNIHQYITFIGGDFRCLGNPITSHILGLMMIRIDGAIITNLGDDGEDINAVLNKWKNQGRKGVMGAMKELIDLGYESLAQI